MPNYKGIKEMSSSSKNNQAATIFKNFSFLALGKIIGNAFTFVLFVVLSRVYGQEGIGEYSFAMAYTGFFLVAADFGLYNLSIKEMSRNDGDISSYFNNILATRLLISSAILLLLVLSILILPFSDASKPVIACLGVYQIIYTLTEGFTALFVSQQRMHMAALVEFTFRFCVAVLSSAVALCGGKLLFRGELLFGDEYLFGGEFLLGNELVYVVALFPIIAVIQLLFVYRYTVKEFNINVLSVSPKLFKQILVTAMPYALFALLRQLSTRIDVLLLGVLMGTAAAGIYNASYRIVFLLLFLPYFVGVAVFPIASKLYANNQQELISLYQVALNLMVLIAIPVTLGLWIISPDLILLIYGGEFTESIFILQLLSLLLGLAFIQSIPRTLLTSCDMQMQITKSQWTCAWLNVLGNIALIPFYGVVGAAISTVFSEFVLTFVMIMKLRPLLGIPDMRLRFLISMLGSSTMISSTLLYPDLYFVLFIPLSIVIYILMLLGFKTIRENEFSMLRKVLNK